ncbi:MAG TPA: hypothetical protein VFJ96_09275 [Gemmatimonadaceae bacterium]|nr:hypothetical protein [Gemmatimonadaceae bacterium]
MLREDVERFLSGRGLVAIEAIAAHEPRECLAQPRLVIHHEARERLGGDVLDAIGHTVPHTAVLPRRAVRPRLSSAQRPYSTNRPSA